MKKNTHSRLHTVFQIYVIVEAKFGDDLNVTRTVTPVSSSQHADKILNLSTGLWLLYNFVTNVLDATLGL